MERQAHDSIDKRRVTPDYADTSYLRQIVDDLKAKGIEFVRGLSDQEVRRTEQRFEFTFPPDLRAFLQMGLPVGPRFPNWRFPDEYVKGRLDWPLEGMLFDIRHNTFWRRQWGEPPGSLEDRYEIARAAVKAAPTLIPIYSHRYIPDEPNLPGNPVLSVYQTDIIYYGFELASYFNHEFGTTLPSWAQSIDYRDFSRWPIRPIRFWDDVAGFNHDPDA